MANSRLLALADPFLALADGSGFVTNRPGEDGTPVGRAVLGDGVANADLAELVQFLRVFAQERLGRLFGGGYVAGELEASSRSRIPWVSISLNASFSISRLSLSAIAALTAMAARPSLVSALNAGLWAVCRSRLSCLTTAAAASAGLSFGIGMPKSTHQ